MGVVYLSNRLILLYRTPMKTKRWYLKALFHCLDKAKINAWLIYRQYCVQRNVPKKSQVSLLKFTASIASALGIKNTANVYVVGRLFIKNAKLPLQYQLMM